MTIFRDILFSIFENLFERSLISKRKLNTIDKLIKTYPNICFGGSISLVSLDIINRRIGDLDIICTEVSDYDKLRAVYPSISPYDHERVRINGIECCLYLDNDPKKRDIIDVKFFGREIRIQLPEKAIEAKKYYIKHSSSSASYTKKHRKDIDRYLDSDYYKLVKKFLGTPIRIDFLVKEWYNKKSKLNFQL